MIFKMRSRVTSVKMNFKRNFENLKCSLCKIENESQKHIIECNEIRKLRGNSFKSVEYENLFGENVKKQLEIMKYF